MHQSRSCNPSLCFKLHTDKVQLLGQIPDSKIPLWTKLTLTVRLVFVLMLITDTPTINYYLSMLTHNRTASFSFVENMVGSHETLKQLCIIGKRSST